MDKKRVYQVAKDFHVSSEALVSMLADLGHQVKSHMSVMTDEMLATVEKQFEKQQTIALKDIQKQKQITEAIDRKASSEEKQRTEPVPQPGPRRPKHPPKPQTTQPSGTGTHTSERRRRPEKPVSHAPSSHPAPHASSPHAKTTKAPTGERGERKTRRSRKRKKKIDQAEVQESFKKTMSSIAADSRSKSKRSRPKQMKANEEPENRVLKVSEYISVSELASLMDVPASEVVQKCLELGVIVSLNHRLDMETMVLLAGEFDYTVKEVGEYAEEALAEKYRNKKAGKHARNRPPVVTVMGHVDHGKTTLLDHIRKASVVSTESGGITQHIGAYSVDLPSGQRITFIDTPGHKAFTAMRARGARVTDIVILVVAADDSVMPQTIEAIDHAKAAGVPIVIAINKIDLPTADIDRLKTDLSRHNILCEDWGGDYQCQEISAKKGTNVTQLLEKVLLEAEMLELKADPTARATGVVIESHIDRGRGTVATVLVQNGTLHIGDPFIAGMIAGNVRAMNNNRGERVNEAGPSTPVQILGMDGVPRAGDTFYSVESESEAREIAQKRSIIRREQLHRKIKRVSLEDLYDKIKEGEIQDLNLIIKADVDGSVEALTDTLTQITHEEVRINVIHSGVGGINENDVLLAAASGAIIIGFHVRPTPHAKNLAAQESVDIKLYNIIYEAVDDVKKALSGLLKPLIKEHVVGSIEVRDVFKIPRIGKIAGAYVTNGTVHRDNRVRVVRDAVEVYEGKIGSLRRFKNDVSEVNQGYECGISIDGYDDIKVGDVLEVFELLEEARNI